MVFAGRASRKLMLLYHPDRTHFTIAPENVRSKFTKKAHECFLVIQDMLNTNS